MDILSIINSLDFLPLLNYLKEKKIILSDAPSCTKCQKEPKSDLGKELTTLSNIERPRADNVDNILTVVEETVKRKRGRPPKNK